MGVLTENWIKRTCCAVWFPYPIKVTGVSYTLENFQADSRSVFPSPPEVTGGSYEKTVLGWNYHVVFPCPLEENGGLTYRPEFYRIVMVNFRPLSR